VKFYQPQICLPDSDVPALAVLDVQKVKLQLKIKCATFQFLWRIVNASQYPWKAIRSVVVIVA